MTCVTGHCNIIVSGETGSGKTELVKYLASHIKEDEKIITIEDTLELHLDKIYPTRDIVAMKTNNIASYSEVLVACMRQNPRWILLSEVRSAEAVTAVRNSISSGHNILSTIHSDKASSIPMRLYSLLESSQDIEQFVKSMHRYIQLGIHVKGFYSKKYDRFQREITQVVEFYVDDEAGEAKCNILYSRDLAGHESYNNPTIHLIDYLASQGVVMREDPFLPIGTGVAEASDYHDIGEEMDALETKEEKKEEKEPELETIESFDTGVQGKEEPELETIESFDTGVQEKENVQDSMENLELKADKLNSVVVNEKALDNIEKDNSQKGNDLEFVEI